MYGIVGWLSHVIIATIYVTASKKDNNVYIHIGTGVVDASTRYVNRTRQMSYSPDSCANGDTPLGFQCITMPNPEETNDINDFPCYTVENVSGRHIGVLVSKLNICTMLVVAIN